MEAAAADIAFIVGEASMELLFDDGGEDAAADAAIAAAVADAGMVGTAGAVVSCSSFVMVNVNELGTWVLCKMIRVRQVLS